MDWLILWNKRDGLDTLLALRWPKWDFAKYREFNHCRVRLPEVTALETKSYGGLVWYWRSALLLALRKTLLGMWQQECEVCGKKTRMKYFGKRTAYSVRRISGNRPREASREVTVCDWHEANFQDGREEVRLAIESFTNRMREVSKWQTIQKRMDKALKKNDLGALNSLMEEFTATATL